MDKLKDMYSGIMSDHTWHMIKDNILAISGLFFGIVVVVLLIALGKFPCLSFIH